jgi:outer membrane protein assembly factor BamE (lipoprotein component of BamABCDE complex)
MKKWLAIMVVGAACALGCATVGKQFDTTHVNDIKKGEDDKAKIKGWFGEPHTTAPVTNSAAGCVERWQWTYAHSVAGGSTVADSLVVDFDKDGKVCDNAYSQVNQ